MSPRIILFALVLLVSAPAFSRAALGVKNQTVRGLAPGRVSDGDTLRLILNGTNHTARLACIDCPETKQIPHGILAKDRLSALTKNQTLSARIVDIDRYGRTVVELFDKKGKNINLSLVASGHCFVYPQYVYQCRRSIYLASEGSAKARKLRIWSVFNGISRPWTCRQDSTKCNMIYAIGAIGRRLKFA